MAKKQKKNKVVQKLFRPTRRGPNTWVPSTSVFSSTKCFAKLIYCEQNVNINPGAGLAGIYQFNLSSLFDPNRTGVGHQPTGFDQYMALYEEYIVTSVTYKVLFANKGLTGAGALVVGCSISDDPSTSLDFRQYIENGQTQWGALDGRGDGGRYQLSLSGSVDIADAHGVSKSELLSGDEYRGTASASPAEMIYLTCWAQDITTGDASGCDIVVEICFNCIFQGGKLNSLS